MPFFGICLGLQTAVIEFARNVCGLEESHSSEFSEGSSDPVICLLDSQLQVTTKGGTMRLGLYPAQLDEGSIAAEVYESTRVSERHRHRYEVNINYRSRLEDAGMVFSGLSPDGLLPEIIELPSHPWYMGVQFHPESILTQGGHRMLANWLGFCGAAPAEALVRALEEEVAGAVAAATTRSSA